MSYFYKKFYTPIKETLEDDFSDLSSHLLHEEGATNNVGLKFVNTIKTENGLKLKLTNTRDPKGTFTTLLEPEFKIPNYNMVFEAKIGTDRKFQDTINFLDLFGQKGSKFFLRGLYEKGKPSGEVGFEFKNGTVALNGSVTYPQNGNVRGIGAGVYRFNEKSLGGDVEFDQEKGVTRYGGKFQVDKSDSTFCLFVNDIKVPKEGNPKKEVGFGYFSKVRPDLNGAVDFKVDGSLNTEIRLGSDLSVDKSTNIKSRIYVKRKDLRLGFAYKQRLTPATKVTLSTDLNSRYFFGTTDHPKNDHRFNFTFTHGDD